MNHNVAVVGSPSTTTEFTVDLLQEAFAERMVGALVAFDAVQSRDQITSVGQIISIELRKQMARGCHLSQPHQARR